MFSVFSSESGSGGGGDGSGAFSPPPPQQPITAMLEAAAASGGAAALHQALQADSLAEKERRLSEMILQLQLVRERLVSQHDIDSISLKVTLNTSMHSENDSMILPSVHRCHHLILFNRDTHFL